MEKEEKSVSDTKQPREQYVASMLREKNKRAMIYKGKTE